MKTIVVCTYEGADELSKHNLLCSSVELRTMNAKFDCPSGGLFECVSIINL